MKERKQQRDTKKSGVKTKPQTAGLKSNGNMTSQKSMLRKKTVSGRKNSRQPNPDLIYSYKSADDRNALDIIETVRRGISFDEFDAIVQHTPFSLAEWATYLQLSERTIQRNQKENKPFQPIYAERIIELTMLYKYGVDVFGAKENFNTWLNTKSIALGGRMPKELFDTRFGVTMVKDELGRIEHGVLA